MNIARQLALEAHKLAPDLVPAAELAGRVMASQGDATRASRIIAKTWELNPHPDLALAYAHTRPGESPRERLTRVHVLAQWTPDNLESAIAVASAAAEAREWGEARDALAPYLDGHVSARICTLMARIEGGETGDQGRVREWLARAVRAPRDPAWTADGYISDRWAPVSPITGALDAFEWKAPVEMLGSPDPLVIEEADPGQVETKTKPVETEAVRVDSRPSEAAQTPSPAPGNKTEELETEIFVAPRAPDDPGPSPSDADDDARDERKFPAPTT
jgi:HemY protein